MLERVRIKGFQSLADVDLELGPLTVIVGRSNSGKSALRRAVEAVIDNAPTTGRLRTGADHMVVELTTEAGTVTWTKGGKGTNVYRVGELVQDKPGSTITPEAQAVLRLTPANFSDQFDKPYLLGESPSKVAAALGELTNITVLFDSIREANRRAKAHASAAGTLKGQLEAAETRLAGFSDLPGEAQALHAQAALLATAKDAERAWATAAQAARAAQARQEQADAAEQVLAQTVDPRPAAAHLEKADTAAQLLQRFAATANAARQWAATAAKELPPEPPDLTEAQATANEAARLADLLGYAREMVAQAHNYGQLADNMADDIAAAQAQLAQYDTCPLCGTVGVHL